MNKNTDKIFKFSAGKYWIGDPCYAVKDENWSTLCDIAFCLKAFNGIFFYNGYKCFAFSTMHGDGVYLDNNDNEYGVDAGLLGILPIETCDGDYLEGGHKFEFENDFTACRDNEGTFYFGNVIIPTGDEEEVDYYEDYDEDYDPYNSDEDEDDEEW